MPSTESVVAEQLVKEFNGLRAVDSVSFKIRRGEIFALLGPNGAGKTTTIKMLSTLLEPTSGDALIEGYSITKQPDKVRRVIGLCPQELTADDEMSGWDNVYIQARLYGMSAREAKTRTRELLEEFNLWEAAGRKVSTYSGGMRRRLEIAMSIVHEPSVVFLDEPTLGLDVQSRRTVWSLIKKLRERGASILLTTHYMEEADILSDRIAIMHRGRIVAEGSPEELKSRVRGDIVIIVPLEPGSVHTIVEKLAKAGYETRPVDGGKIAVRTTKATEELPTIMDALSGVRLKSINILRPSLEQVFVELTGESLGGDEEPMDSFRMRRVISHVSRR